MDNPQTEKTIPDRTNAGDGIIVWDRRGGVCCPAFFAISQKIFEMSERCNISPRFSMKFFGRCNISRTFGFYNSLINGQKALKGALSMSILQIVDLKKDYGEEPNITHALKGIQFEVDKGEFVGIMGASGSGKTTLLNCISTIDTATDGHIYLDGKDILEIREKDIARFRRESLGFIFQDFNLLDTLTIEENIALALTISKVSANKIDSQIQQIAAKLNITDILNKYPYRVSGGQKQRCACARAIINHPKLILADEPTGALDSHSSQMLLSTIQEMNEQMDATILMVTHDAFSASYANRILFLRDGEIYKEIMKGSSSRKEFFEQILEVLNTLGGGVNDVH